MQGLFRPLGLVPGLAPGQSCGTAPVKGPLQGEQILSALSPSRPPLMAQSFASHPHQP